MEGAMRSVRKITRRFVLGAVFVLLAGLIGTASLSLAQVSVSTGSLSGTVTDPQGATVSSAKVTVSNKESGKNISLETSGEGSFTSGALAPGNYTLRVEAKGF